MELIMISSSKLKIMLSQDDMARYSLGVDIDYTDLKTRRAFRSILDEAKKKTGFDAESEKIYIQLFPSKKGGCEVYITKIDEDTENDCDPMRSKLAESRALYKSIERCAGIIPAPKRHQPKERRRAYSFPTSELLVRVCRRLLFIGWRGQSSAYRGDCGKFYIILKEKPTPDLVYADRLSFILEYGDAENHSATSKYLCEHGSCICRSEAVEKLGVL